MLAAMRFSADELEVLRQYLRAGETEKAILLYRKHYPPYNNAYFPDLNAGVLDGLLIANPPSLCFLAHYDLTEIQITAAMVALAGMRHKPSNLFPEGYIWNYGMTPKAAVHHITSHLNWIRSKSDMDVYGLKWVIRLSHSCEPVNCLACTDAGKYLYTLENFPGLPIPGCSNLKEGCRCSQSAYRPSRAEELMRRHGLIRR